MILGAQFYTLRDHCKTLEDLSESLNRVADIGYRTVQISGTRYALVEQDMCYGEDPFLCLKKSYNYLTAMGLK